MKNKLNIDSLYRPIANFGNIGLEHRVNLFEPSKIPGEKNVPYRKDFVSTKSKGGIIGFKSVAFRNTRDSIILKGVSFSKDDIKRIPPSVYLTYSDVSEVKRIFTTASSWFTSDIINDFFWKRLRRIDPAFRRRRQHICFQRQVLFLSALFRTG